MIVQVWPLPYSSGHPGLNTQGPSTLQGPSTWNEGDGDGDGDDKGDDKGVSVGVEAAAGRK